MKRSKFNLSHQLLSTGDYGFLYPILIEDLLPGDKVKASSEVFIKGIPLLAPILDLVDVRVDYFFVPNRLIWDRWQDFITGGRDGTVDISEPWFTYNPRRSEDPTDVDLSGPEYTAYMSALYQLNTKTNAEYGQGGIKISALPAFAYRKIYYDWYADLNFEEDEYTDQSGNRRRYDMIYSSQVQRDGHLNIVSDEPSGTDYSIEFSRHDFQLLQRKFKKDMFTSALPWPQRGPQVGFDIPPKNVDTTDSNSVTFTGISNDNEPYVGTSGEGYFNARFYRDSVGVGNKYDLTTPNGEPPFTHQHTYDHDSLDYLEVAKGAFGTLTIPELRRLSALQRWFEKNARFGSRYIEQILSHFGVRTPDYRLGRSEYLGGTVTPLNISQTFQTGEGATGQETYNTLGQYSGHISSYGVNRVRKYTAQEHGWFIGLLSIVPKPSYSQGLQRRFTRFNRLDYAWPEFASIGEQAILNKELYIGSNDSDFAPQSGNNKLNATFGYTRRYSEYMSRQNRYDGNFLNIFPFWHLGRIFEGNPVLSTFFLNSQEDVSSEGASIRYATQYDRIFSYSPNTDPDTGAYQDKFHFLFQVMHHVSMRRPLPKYVNPSLQ